MKQFFFIVFGGLAIMGLSLGLVRGVRYSYHYARPMASNIWGGLVSSVENVADFSQAVVSKIKIPSFKISTSTKINTAISSTTLTDNTVIDGLRRIIRYTAEEEEDLINAATMSLTSISPADNKVKAKAYIVKNLTIDSPAVISYNADTALPIASVTKLVTAIVARQKISPNQKISITKEITTTYGNTAQFKNGETYLAKDLYYPMLLVSSNDAAEAFAYSYGRKEFIQAMNDFAQKIGAYHTYFEDASGLSPRNVSSASDLVLILDWIRLNDPEILEISDTKSKKIKNHTYINPSHFLNWSNYIGGKNGYTPEASRTGALLFTMGPRKNIYAVIILGSPGRDADVVKLLAKVKE